MDLYRINKRISCYRVIALTILSWITQGSEMPRGRLTVNALLKLIFPRYWKTIPQSPKIWAGLASCMMDPFWERERTLQASHARRTTTTPFNSCSSSSSICRTCRARSGGSPQQCSSSRSWRRTMRTRRALTGAPSWRLRSWTSPTMRPSGRDAGSSSLLSERQRVMTKWS